MDGILIVDKPQGMTSHDVVDFLRKRFGLTKVGHAGTLDPMATGVLVMLIGRLTKSSGTFMSADKEYEAAMTLGANSDTGDAWGKMEPTGESTDLGRDEIEGAFKRFLGEIDQTPPMYSSVKVNGRKLYELARKGLKADVKPRRVSVKEIKILEISLPRILFKITCSKGTYIRQICVDIGKVLGCGAHLSALKRTRSGRFTIGEAVGMEKLRKMSTVELNSCLSRA